MVLKGITVPNLFIVDFYADRSELSEDMKRWMDGHLNSKVLAVENCERRIWMGHWETFETLPNLKNYRNANIYEDSEAYSFMLKYMSGLVNPHGLDRPANDRFYEATAKMVARDARAYSTFHNIVALLQRDSGFIISNVCDHVKPTRPWLIARELAGQKKGADILIIGKLDEDGAKVSDVTQRMIMTANGYNGEEAESLTCITLGDDGQKITSERIEKLRSLEKLRIPNVATTMPENLFTDIELADVVYVTIPLGEDLDFDIMLKDVWKNRVRTDNTLIHTDIRNASNDENFSRGLQNYASASTIKALQESRIAKFNAQKKQAEAIADTFSEIRVKGLSPERDMAKFPLPKLGIAA